MRKLPAERKKVRNPEIPVRGMRSKTEDERVERFAQLLKQLTADELDELFNIGYSLFVGV